MSDLEMQLSKRERQIMDALFTRGAATVAEIAAGIPDAPSHTALRTLLRILEDKGHVRRRRDGRAHVYSPRVSRQRAARSALGRLLGTFFGGSLEAAIASHLSDPRTRIDDEELARLARLIREARRTAEGET